MFPGSRSRDSCSCSLSCPGGFLPPVCASQSPPQSNMSLRPSPVSPRGGDGVTRVGVGPLLRTFQSQCSSSCHIVSASRWWNTGRRARPWGTLDQPKSDYAMGHNRDTEVRGLPTPRAQGWFHTGGMVGEGLGTGPTHSEDKWDKGLGLGSTQRRVLDQGAVPRSIA